LRRFFVNDAPHEAPDDSANLLEVMRRTLGLRAAPKGCSDGTCGSCRVLIDGHIVHACTRTTGSIAEHAQVVSYEHIAQREPVVAALSFFDRERSTRCKLCVAGLGVTACALASARAANLTMSTDAAVGTAACMCTGRGSWRRALAVV